MNRINRKEYNEGLELKVLRETEFYKKLRPYTHNRLSKYSCIEDRLIHEHQEHKISLEDRYFAKLDILFGQVFQNVQVRQFWKEQIERLLTEDQIDLLALASLDRAYINELVILFERLASFLVLLQKAFGDETDVSDLEDQLLSFFSPILFDKRVHNQHYNYLWFPKHAELLSFESDVLAGDLNADQYCNQYFDAVTERLNWIKYTEKELSEFLKPYFDGFEQKIIERGEYKEPTNLPLIFSIQYDLSSDVRRRRKHRESFW
jgi:hypothetical protein